MKSDHIHVLYWVMHIRDDVALILHISDVRVGLACCDLGTWLRYICFVKTVDKDILF